MMSQGLVLSAGCAAILVVGCGKGPAPLDGAGGHAVAASSSTGPEGSGGAAGQGGGGGHGAGGNSSGEDTPPLSPLNVTATKARHQHTFMTKVADPMVTFNDNTEIAVVDPRAAKMVGKLVIPMGGVGSDAGGLGGGGEFCARRGFHVFGVAVFENYNILLNDPDFYGDARLEVFDGIEHTHVGDFANIHLTPADGVEQRVAMGLAYLEGLYPEEDWGYFLNADKSVRWSDVYFTGYSHGASNAARFAMVRRLAGAVSSAGPRDNMCSDLACSNNGVVAKWLSETPKTPVERFFAFTGTLDGQHTQHQVAMEKIGYVGSVVDLDSMKPPYGGSHRWESANGHADFCGDVKYKDACNLAFNVPPENADGVP